MKHVVAAMLLLAGCTTPAPVAMTAAHRRAIVDSVQQMLSSWRTAFNSGSVDAVTRYYSSDSAFRWLENGEVKFRSAHALVDTMRAEVRAFRDLGLTLTETEIVPTGPGAATVSGTFTQKVVDTAGGTFGIVGAITLSAVHGDSGWQFVAGHISIVPPDRGASAAAPARGQ